MSSRKKLKNVKSEDIDRFTLDGQEVEAKVVSIHDGDTCDVVFKLYGIRMERFNCRFLGYDAPELKEKPKGHLARDYLAHLVTGGDPGSAGFLNPKNVWPEEQLQEQLDESKNLLYAKFGKFDSFGRALVTLYRNSADKESINDIMKKFIKKLNK